MSQYVFERFSDDFKRVINPAGVGQAQLQQEGN